MGSAEFNGIQVAIDDEDLFAIGGGAAVGV